MNGNPKPPAFRDLIVACLAGLLGFSLFGVAASVIVAVVLRDSLVPGDDALAVRSLIKAACFLPIIIGTIYGLWRFSARKSGEETPPEPIPRGYMQYTGLVAALILLPPLLFPNLASHPWTAPDELYHFTVARNLAEYGVYGSGSPGKGFHWFDPYDSVGAPVIVPVALAFKAMGSTVFAGRTVMVAYFLLCCLFAWLLIRPAVRLGFGLVALCLGLSFGSVYLSRTLYGEIPAFTWFLCALLLWRQALNAKQPAAWAIAAGVAAGLAVLTKSVLALSGFACLAVFIHDQLTERRIRWSHCLWPGLGAGIPLAVWWLYQATHSHDVATAAGGTLVYYRAYLMAGFGGVLPVLKWCASSLIAFLVMLLATGWIGARFARRGGDPALRILWVTAMLYAGWWMFFTPGNIPRYFWYTSATTAICLAWLLADVETYMQVFRPKWIRFAVLILFMMAGITGLTAWLGMYNAVQRDEMFNDYAVAGYLKTLPADAKITTDYWPLERAMDFLAQRDVTVVAGPEDPAFADVTYFIRKTGGAPPPGMAMVLGSEDYEVWRK